MNLLYYYDPETEALKAVPVDPPVGYIDDTDYLLRSLAHRAEGDARKARDDQRNGDAAHFAALAVRYHRAAEARYTPAVPVVRQIPEAPKWEGVLAGFTLGVCGLALAIELGLYFAALFGAQ